MKKYLILLANAVPVVLMIILIPAIKNDYVLTAVYIAIIGAAFAVKRQSKEVIIFFFGFFVMIASEYLFISTGVETFIRNSLLGLMPLWLPFLWGYSFVAIKRGVQILETWKTETIHESK